MCVVFHTCSYFQIHACALHRLAHVLNFLVCGVHRSHYYATITVWQFLNTQTAHVKSRVAVLLDNEGVCTCTCTCLPTLIASLGLNTQNSFVCLNTWGAVLYFSLRHKVRVHNVQTECERQRRRPLSMHLTLRQVKRSPRFIFNTSDNTPNSKGFNFLATLSRRTLLYLDF